MKTRRRIRGTIKWGGAVLTVLLLIVWVGSAWYFVTADFPAIGVGVGGGVLSIILHELPAGANVNSTSWIGPQSYGGQFEWWFTYRRFSLSRFISIPIWSLALLTATPTFLIWRHDRKRPPGVCIKCGYSRTGLPADRACPECGCAAS